MWEGFYTPMGPLQALDQRLYTQGVGRPRLPALRHALGLSASDELDNNNGYGYFAALDGLIVTEPTRTNVNDLRAILILETAHHDA